MLQGFLLDLPELALVEIAKHLPTRDVASCMMSCATLRELLQPRLNAMVSARHMGRKWVLRACNRALFKDVAKRVAVGVAQFEGPETIPNWEKWTAALWGATEHGPELFREWTRLKALCQSPISTDIVDLNLFFYHCRLAESRGFSFTVGILERVWERAVSMVSIDSAPGFSRKHWGAVFDALRVAESPDLGFVPFEDFAGDQFFPGPLELGCSSLRVADVAKVEVCLFKVAVDIWPSEMMCFFVAALHSHLFKRPQFWLPRKDSVGKAPPGFRAFLRISSFQQMPDSVGVYSFLYHIFYYFYFIRRKGCTVWPFVF